MGIFATRARRDATEDPEASRELLDHGRVGLPPRFEAVGEALASGSGSSEACSVLGRELARDGASLGEALEGLRATSLVVLGREPGYDDISAMCTAWSETTLGYLHQLSCEDPLTGLASLAHVRSRLSELYRGEGRSGIAVGDTFALVVADSPHSRHGFDGLDRAAALSRAMRMARLGESARTVFSGPETIGRLGEHRIVVLAQRDDRLGRRVAILRRLLGSLDLAGHTARVWIEGLPSTDDGAGVLLDELARV